MKKIFCIFIVFSIILMPVANTQARLLGTKIQGKLSLIFLLTGMAALTKLLVNRDKKVVVELHTALGPPDRIVEFQKGFDRWRIEWYGQKSYLFRNGVLQFIESWKAGKAEGEKMYRHSEKE